mmetsp:Transcript_34829/g.76224  ORF Transcript_34829/g.76224 Transcript_34829/m.76224 type:complete len:91 (-) Transcript_34829:771-1043(-)
MDHNQVRGSWIERYCPPIVLDHHPHFETYRFITCTDLCESSGTDQDRFEMIPIPQFPCNGIVAALISPLLDDVGMIILVQVTPMEQFELL